MIDWYYDCLYKYTEVIHVDENKENLGGYQFGESCLKDKFRDSDRYALKYCNEKNILYMSTHRVNDSEH